MKPTTLYLCYKCKNTLDTALKLTLLKTTDPKKQKCQHCGEMCYGELYLVKDKLDAKL